MRKLILIGLLLVLAWSSAAQSRRTGTYTSYDGVLQVEYMQGWRIGGIEPDLESFEEISRREAPESYQLNLLHSRPEAEIVFFVVDFAEFIPEGEDPLEFLQKSLEETQDEIEFTSLSLGENEAIEVNISDLSGNMALGGGRIDLADARRLIFTIGRSNWFIFAVLFAEDETLDEDFLTIASSFRFNGSNRNILSLSGDVSMDVPENWFRSINSFAELNEWEQIQLYGEVMREFCIAAIDIIDLDSPRFEFPEEGSPDNYLEAFLNGRENNYEPLNIYAEHLAEGVHLYMSEEDDDYWYLSLQVLEEHLIISTTYLGEGYCIDDYFLLINSVREE